MKTLCTIACFLLLLPAATGVYAQQDTLLKPVRTISTEVADLTTDNLGNIYLVTPAGQLKKFSAAGDSIGVYNDVRRFGKLHSVHVSDALKPLLYYRDFSTIVVLDRQLSVRTAIDLRRHNIIQASAISLSYDNQIWLFDEYENKLKKIGEDGKLLMETADLRMVFPKPILPQQIIDQDGTVYLYDARSGIYLFDHYGTFKKKVPITQWKSIAIRPPYIAGISGHNLHYYHTGTLLSAQKKLPFPRPESHNFHFAGNRVFAWTKDSVHIYSYPF